MYLRRTFVESHDSTSQFQSRFSSTNQQTTLNQSTPRLRPLQAYPILPQIES